MRKKGLYGDPGETMDPMPGEAHSSGCSYYKQTVSITTVTVTCVQPRCKRIHVRIREPAQMLGKFRQLCKNTCISL